MLTLYPPDMPVEESTGVLNGVVENMYSVESPPNISPVSASSYQQFHKVNFQ